MQTPACLDRQSRPWLTALALALCLLLPACGGGDPDDEALTPPPATPACLHRPEVCQ